MQRSPSLILSAIFASCLIVPQLAFAKDLTVAADGSGDFNQSWNKVVEGFATVQKTLEPKLKNVQSYEKHLPLYAEREQETLAKLRADERASTSPRSLQIA
jgi:hypothetical protein